MITEPLRTSILAISNFGGVVFAISGALTAARYRMDVLGFVLVEPSPTESQARRRMVR